MVAYYMHDIADWMDATGDLTAGEYRVYHTIIMLIYLNEGPIRNHERGIAGRCDMRVDWYRKRVATLVRLGLVSITSDGRLSNDRCESELRLIADRRQTSSRGGRKRALNALKNKDAPSSPLQHKRLEKTREENNKGTDALDTPFAALSTVLDATRAKAVVDHRKKLNKPLTTYAAERLASSLARAPDANKAADVMIERGWQGYNPEWATGTAAAPPKVERMGGILIKNLD